MKKFLLFSMTLLAGVFSNNLMAQGQGGGGNASPTSACDIYDILVQNVSVSGPQTAGTCTATFDVAFSMDVNNGLKHIFLQTYIASAMQNGSAANNPHPYPNYFQCENGTTSVKTPPTSEDAGNPLLNVAINVEGDVPLFEEYIPDTDLEIVGVTASTQIESVMLENGDTRFLITGLQVVLPNECGSNTQYEFATDIFASQTPKANTLHCVSCGIGTVGGTVNVTGVVNCDMIMATFTNTTAAEIEVIYEFYADNGDGVFATQNTEDALITTDTVMIEAGASLPIMPVNVTNIDASLVGREVFVVINIGGARRAELLDLIECIPLPVSFGSFNAQRNRSNVILTWETETESNSRGFELQRELGDNKWQSIAFIPSKAEGGNSTSVIRYEHSDMNTHRGISNYRIRQVDFDGQMMISPVRSVRGDGQPNGTVVFPNPSSNGQVNVIFESVRDQMDLSLVDMSGRILKQWQNYSDNSLQITNLQPGMYNLRIINRSTGVVSNEKIVVSRN